MVAVRVFDDVRGRPSLACGLQLVPQHVPVAQQRVVWRKTVHSHFHLKAILLPKFLGVILDFGARARGELYLSLARNRRASHNFKVSTNSVASSGESRNPQNIGQKRLYFADCAVFEIFAISCAKRAAILLSPFASAIFIPSSSSLSTRGISPLPSSTPTLRKMRA